MRVPRSLKVLVLLTALFLVAAAPAGAAQTLVLTCTVCSEVIATGTGLPANEVVHLTLHDVTTGQEVVKPVPVRTNAEGKFLAKVKVDLTRHPSLESSVWRTNGQVLVIAAHNRFNSPCKPKKPANGLAFTGSHTSQLLGGGLGLLVVGGLLIMAGSRRRAGLTPRA
jgi:hypothetical protein